MGKLYINKIEDQMAVAAILVKYNYTVRRGSEKRAGNKSLDHFLEFERSDSAKKRGAEDES